MEVTPTPIPVIEPLLINEYAMSSVQSTAITIAIATIILIFFIVGVMAILQFIKGIVSGKEI